MVEIKFNKVFQFKSYNQAPSIFNECRDLFKKYGLTYVPEGKLWEGLSPYMYEEFFDILSDIDEVKEDFDKNAVFENLAKPEQEISSERIIPDYSLLNFPPLVGKHPYENFQKIDIQQGLMKSRYAYMLGMGSGKSYIMSALIAHRYKLWRQARKVLILTSGIGVWNLYQEILKFIKDLNPDKIYVADRLHRHPFDADKDIVIMSYNTFRIICNDYKKEEKIKSQKPRKPFLPIEEWADNSPCMICLDESHEISRRDSQKAYFVHLHAPLFKYRYLFTGTPADTPEKLYNQFDTLDPWLVYGMTYSQWLQKVAYVGTPWSAFAVRGWNQEELKKQNERFLENHGIYRKSEDIVVLPEHRIRTLRIPMEEHHRSLYQNLVKEDLARRQEDDSWGQMSTSKTISMFTYMMLACDCPSLLSKNLEKFSPQLVKEIKSFKPDYLRKIDVVEDIVESHPDEKGIVWILHPDTAKILNSRLSKYNPICITGETDDRNALLDKFRKDPKCKVLIGSILVLNTSTTLTEASYQVYAERGFNLTVYEQSKFRIYRQGQTKDVETTILCYDKSLDCMLDKNLENKGKLVEGLCSKNFIDKDTWKTIFNFTEDSKLY